MTQTRCNKFKGSKPVVLNALQLLLLLLLLLLLQQLWFSALKPCSPHHWRPPMKVLEIPAPGIGCAQPRAGFCTDTPWQACMQHGQAVLAVAVHIGEHSISAHSLDTLNMQTCKDKKGWLEMLGGQMRVLRLSSHLPTSSCRSGP